jgi:hypothetical protein
LPVQHINPYNGTIVASDDSYEDETVKCSNYISNAMLEHNNISIPCDGCPDPNNNLVENIGGGWVYCGSPWPVVCRNTGIHHRHCSSTDRAGIFMQTFPLANLPTDELPSNDSRSVALSIRLLKGYDDDFSQAVVVVWVKETTPTKAAALLVDTKWETHATVLEDIMVASSYPIPSPSEHERINLVVAIIPIDRPNDQVVVANNVMLARTCRLNIHSILGEFV